MESDNDAWQKFNDEFLKPFEKRGYLSQEFGPNVNVFSYLQVRIVAFEAFKRGKQADKNLSLKPPERKEV